jgi:hypothetical protein
LGSSEKFLFRKESEQTESSDYKLAESFHIFQSFQRCERKYTAISCLRASLFVSSFALCVFVH